MGAGAGLGLPTGRFHISLIKWRPAPLGPVRNIIPHSDNVVAVPSGTGLGNDWPPNPHNGVVAIPTGSQQLGPGQPMYVGGAGVGPHILVQFPPIRHDCDVTNPSPLIHNQSVARRPVTTHPKPGTHFMFRVYGTASRFPNGCVTGLGAGGGKPRGHGFFGHILGWRTGSGGLTGLGGRGVLTPTGLGDT